MAPAPQRSRSASLRTQLPLLRNVLLALLAALAAATGIAPTALAQGSALDYLDKADLDRARSPQEVAAQQTARAERHFRKAEKLYAQAQAAPQDAKLAEKATQEYERAVADFEKAIAKDPASVDAHLQAGLAYSRLREFEKALTACHQAWHMAPAKSNAAVCQAEAALALDRPRQVQEIYLQLASIDARAAQRVLDGIRAWIAGHPDHASTAPLAAWAASVSSS
jgi:tetratricopeptide (TPR) repeat protein